MRRVTQQYIASTDRSPYIYTIFAMVSIVRSRSV